MMKLRQTPEIIITEVIKMADNKKLIEGLQAIVTGLSQQAVGHDIGSLCCKYISEVQYESCCQIFYQNRQYKKTR